MTPLQMIEQWRKGCSCSPAGRPEECPTCTRALVDALERKLQGHALLPREPTEDMLTVLAGTSITNLPPDKQLAERRAYDKLLRLSMSKIEAPRIPKVI